MASWGLWEPPEANMVETLAFDDTFETSGTPSGAHMLEPLIFYTIFQASVELSGAHMLKIHSY